jgi:nitroimidazol reductase NimA-like FMN-containing flavoprotein (pyridoxamine 5'-phosphate oxidase superfamily)
MSAVTVAARSGPRELSPAEVSDLLAAQGWGVLATAGEDGPYAVPVAYALDGDALVIASGPGEKLRHLLADPRVCLTVTQVTDGDRWHCVVARGVARPVRSTGARVRALLALAGARGTRPTRTDLVRAARAHVFRLERLRVSGRARGCEPHHGARPSPDR